MCNWNYNVLIYLLFSSYYGQYMLSWITSGSAQLKFNKTDFRNLNVIIPPESYLIKLEKELTNYTDKIESNNQQIQSLSKTRDAFLPKLMSGKVRVRF